MPKTIQNFIYRIIALILLILFIPVFIVLFIFVKLTSYGPFIFRQKRAGKDKKPFFIYKIRTMVHNAESLKTKFYRLNEADGPVFKIRNDPRHTKVGRIISHLGLDELPQLIDIIKGEMSFVGPRPLPMEEAKKVPKKYRARFSVLPGITSPWVVAGSHRLTFKEWMELDLKYVKNKSLWYDFKISLRTVLLICRILVEKIV